MGSNEKQPHSCITRRQNVNSVQGMEVLHREFWQQNFQISPNENTVLKENLIRLNNLTPLFRVHGATFIDRTLKLYREYTALIHLTHACSDPVGRGIILVYATRAIE